MKFWKDWSKETFQKVFIVVMFAAAAVYGTFQFYVLKHNALRVEHTAKLQLILEQIEEAEKMALRARRDAPQRAKVEAFVAQHRERMIVGDAYAWINREFTLLSEDQPARIRSFTPAGGGQVSLRNQYETVAVQLECEGSFDDLARVIQNLENTFATGQIRGLELVGSPDGAHTARFQIVLLVVPPPRVIGPVGERDVQPKEAS